MLFKSMYIIYVNHDSVIKQICQLRDKAFLINETRSKGTLRSPRLHFYDGQLIKKLANAIYKVSALISNRATSEKVRKQCVEVHSVSPN